MQGSVVQGNGGLHISCVHAGWKTAYLNSFADFKPRLYPCIPDIHMTKICNVFFFFFLIKKSL